MLLDLVSPLASGGLLVLVGCTTVLLGAMNVARGLRSKRWPTVRGRIVQVRMQPVDVVDPGGFPTKQTMFKPVVQYRYSVNDREYTGSRLRMGGPGLGALSWAWSQTGVYAQGQEVIIHVSPADPRVSVLEPGIGGQIVAVILFGMACAAYGIYILLRHR